MIKPENEGSSGYPYDPNDLTQVYFFGDFLRKTSHLLKDSEEKWKLVCKATDVQNTEWPTTDAYHRELKKVEKSLMNHVGSNQDSFTL